MLADFVAKIVGLANDAVKPVILDLPNNPAKKLLIIGNERTEIDVPANVRDHRFDTLESFVSAVNHFSQDEELQPVVWIGTKSITAIVDDRTRRDKLVFPLMTSEVLEAAAKLTDEAMSQAKFVDLLRNDFAAAVPASILPKIRKIEATSGARMQSEVAHGKEKGLGEFQAELVGASEIPEVLTLEVPIYSNVTLEVEKIACSLTITLPPGPITFKFSPLPDQVTWAVQNSQRQLFKLLTDSLPPERKIPVFLGNPG